MNRMERVGWAEQLERRAERAQNEALAQKMLAAGAFTGAQPEESLEARINRALRWSNSQLSEINADLRRALRRKTRAFHAACWIAAAWFCVAAWGWALVILR